MHHNQTVKAKADEGNLKVTRSNSSYTWAPKERLTSDILSENTGTKRLWDKICNCWEKKNCQWKIQFLTKLFLWDKGEIKTFPDKQKLRVFPGRPALQQILKGALQVEMKHQREIS